ncbi:MAG: hypothetical protein HYV09_31220 [Deltaproteobacteria bacterium]|nr:hypothetical protein [Deltaproteobacteria bacterium]
MAIRAWSETIASSPRRAIIQTYAMSLARAGARACEALNEREHGEPT